jgi:Glucose / Sorbosone dehydrogenase
VRIPFSLIAALLVGLSWVFFTEPASAATLQPGFEDQIVTSVGSPTSLAFAPDGRMLLTSQSGQLRVLDKDGSLLESPALDLAAEICANPSSTKGLLGVAVDPASKQTTTSMSTTRSTKPAIALAPLSTGWPVTLSRATTSPPSTASW